MKISYQSELMKNQKHAVVMAPDRAFEVLQSSDGDALFFSIGTDNAFYLTREVTGTSTGWNRLNLSGALASQHGGATVAAKAFSVTQNAKTLGVDLALVVTVSGQDYLYLSLGNVNTDASWANGVSWTAVPFDAGTAPNPLAIADVFIMNVPPAADGTVENIFVDVVRTPGDPLSLLDRYYIKPTATPKWNLQKLAADLSAGSISSCLGHRAGDPLPGIYTFGTINSEPELIFTPQYNYFKPNVAPSPVRLNLPTGASAVASARNTAGDSNLFVAATGGLYVFTPTNQKDKLSNAVLVVAGGLVAGASALAAASTATVTAVWGVDPQGALFYVTCPAGREADPTAWSHAVPLVPAAEGFAFYLNLGAGNNVLFAHVDGQNLIQLTQDPVTTEWQQRNILLPPTNTDDVVEYNSFTTHIQVFDDNNVAASNTVLSVTATSPVSVYLNDVYHLLSPTVPANIAADATGVLTAVQETQSLTAVCFRVALAADPSVSANINPMDNALTTLGKVKAGPDLDIQVTNADGSQQPLVPASVSPGDRDAAAKSIAQFVTINSGLPKDGSPQTAAAAAAAPAALARTATVPPVWGVSFTGAGLTYHQGTDAVQQFGPRLAARGLTLAPQGLAAPEDLGSAITVAAGDFWDWLVSVFDEVESFVVQEVKGLYHFLATIAGEVYDVLLDCVAAVVNAVEFVLNKIEVFFEDLIKWLGFLFQWGDILRTHDVLKNVFNTYMGKCVDGLGTARADIQAAFTSIQQSLDAWAGIPDNIPPSLSGGTLDGTTRSAGQAPGQDTPQANWGLHHLKSNAASGNTTAQPGQGIVGDILSVLKPLTDALEREKEVFQAAYDSFKANIIDKIHELSFPQIIEGVFAIVADALLQSVENVLLAAIDVLIELVEGTLEGLNATIDIPVISWVYQQITGNDLSLLDLSCLVAAIPVTICYKLIAEAAPFPDNATTSALISAPDWTSFRKIINNPPVALTAKPAALTAEAVVPAATISTSDNNICVLTGGIASAVGALSLSIFSPLKQKFPEVKPFAVINGLSYLLYVAPDMMGQIPDLQNAKWWAITNNAISDLMVVKSMVDMGVGLTPLKSAARTGWDPVSPWLDFGGNIAWQVPTTFAFLDPENWNTAGILGFVGGSCFDCNGILGPVLADDSEPISWGITVALATLFNLAYGAMSCAASVLTFES